MGEGKRQYTVAKSKPLFLNEEIGDGMNSENCLCHGDNKVFMKTLLDEYGMKGKINMIYIDPPFFSKSDYDAVLKAGDTNIRHLAYADRWEKGLSEYLRMCAVRLMMMKDLLADDGLIWVHLDWHVVHYVKILMDEIFGEKNFVNEIVWTYKSGGTSKRHFSRKHDTILVYSKTGKYKFFPLKEKSYNRQFKPYRFKGVKEYKDDIGWYTMVNMKDVWNIDMVGRTSSERTGYATQKPEQLLSSIIQSCTEEGDICADFFSGSGTLPAVAAEMNRRFIGCDMSKLAIESTINRLAKERKSFCVCNFGKEEKSKLNVEFDFSYKEIPGSDKIVLAIELKNVRSKGMMRNVERNSKDAVKQILKDDPLKMISSWSIDFSYNGKVHRPEVIFTRNGNELQVIHEKIISGSKNISIKVVDIFGNAVFERRPTMNSQ